MMDALHRLSTPDLAALAAALRSGRLAPPFAEVAVRRYCGAGMAATVAAGFEALRLEGFAGRQLAYLLEAITRARASQPTVGDVVELTWTGPEAPGVTNRDTGVVVRELFGSATEEVLVAGFAVYQGHDVFRALADRMAELPSLRVRMFLDVQRRQGEVTPSSELVWRFLTRFRTKQWPGERLPKLFYDPRSLDERQEKRSSLHAKCVVADRRVAFVTSANFTEAAHTRNLEVGALIREHAFAAQLCQQFDALVAGGHLLEFPDLTPLL